SAKLLYIPTKFRRQEEKVIWSSRPWHATGTEARCRYGRLPRKFVGLVVSAVAPLLELQPGSLPARLFCVLEPHGSKAFCYASCGLAVTVGLTLLPTHLCGRLYAFGDIPRRANRTKDVPTQR